MGRILIIAEKSSVASDIGNVLGIKKKKSGYLEGPGYYISWLKGHLLTLYEPQDYSERYKKWNLDDLPIIPAKFKHKVIENKYRPGQRNGQKPEEQLKTIKQLANSEEVEEIYCATDPGAEGEYIFREAYYYIKCRKPVKRMWIKSRTEQGIRTALNDMKSMSEYDNLYYSAKARSEADWLVGMNLSRAYSVSMNVNYSIGRVQTPVLSILVRRELEIQNFIPEKFITLKSKYGAFTASYFVPDRTDGKPAEWIIDRAEAESIKRRIAGEKAILENLVKENKVEKSPLLYDLDTLRIDCNSLYGLTAEETLATVQSLYERKLVSYPRTDSNYLSSKDVPVLFDIINALKTNYSIFVKEIVDNNYDIRPNLINDEKVTEHSALVPTEVPLNGGLSEVQFKVYDLICKRFLSSFYPEYKATSINVILDYPQCKIEGKFRASDKITTSLGWKRIYDDKEETTNIGELIEGAEYLTESVAIDEKTTRPPSRYTDGSLIEVMLTAGRYVEDPEARRAMKEKGLGTPATRSAIIERLISVGYVQRIGKTLYPTPKGIELISLIQEEPLKTPELTGEWEKKRTLIEKGEYSPEAFMTEIGSFVKTAVYRIRGYEGNANVLEVGNFKDKKAEDSKIERGKTKDNQKKSIVLEIKIDKPKAKQVILKLGKR